MKINLLLLPLVIFSLFSISAIAHVPFLEFRDYSEERPYVVRRFPEQSKAIYAWLENDGETVPDDIDVYKFKIKRRPIQVYIELIVPVYEDYYDEFVPWFALVGPGLPAPNISLPFDIPCDYGAIVKENVEPGEERETFYEPFGGKSYYKGPIYEEEISASGTYYVYVWDPHQMGGDYVLVLGKGELFLFADILRGLIYTPMIRNDMELHID